MEINEEKVLPEKKKNMTEKFRDNPWLISTVVLSILVIIMLIGNFTNFTGDVVSEREAGDAIVELAKSQIGDIEITDVTTESGLYKILYSSESGDGVVYLTLDGKNLVSGLVPLNLLSEEDGSDSPSQSEGIPKSDKPVVELFIWAYCPYGVQAQAPFAEVALLLGDKADFKTILYYDGHGAYETQQNKIQACIQEVALDKYWDYAEGFVSNIYPKCSSTRDVDCDKTESVKLMNSLGIDSSEVMSCVDSEGETLIGEHSQRAGELGVTGSPTLVINGVKVNVARDAESFKDAICSSFEDAPEECSTSLSTGSATASGNC